MLPTAVLNAPDSTTKQAPLARAPAPLARVAYREMRRFTISKQ